MTIPKSLIPPTAEGLLKFLKEQEKELRRLCIVRDVRSSCGEFAGMSYVLMYHSGLHYESLEPIPYDRVATAISELEASGKTRWIGGIAAPPSDDPEVKFTRYRLVPA